MQELFREQASQTFIPTLGEVHWCTLQMLNWSEAAPLSNTTNTSTLHACCMFLFSLTVLKAILKMQDQVCEIAGEKKIKNIFFSNLQFVRGMYNLISCWELILVLQSQCLSGERPPLLVRAGSKFKNNVSQRKLRSYHPTRVVFLSVQNPLHIHSNGVMQGTEVRRSLCWGGNLPKPRVSRHDFYFCHFPYTAAFLGRNPTAVTALQQRYLPECTVWGLSSHCLEPLRSDILLWDGLPFIKCPFCIAYPVSTHRKVLKENPLLECSNNLPS